MSALLSLSVNVRAAKRVREGYPWVFGSDLHGSEGLASLAPGQLVHFAAPDSSIIATGYAHPKMQLLGRVLAPGRSVIDQAFFAEKFRAANEWRLQSFGGQPYYRLAHAESDGLPGLVIDRFGDTLAVQVNTAGMEALQESWLPALQELFAGHRIVLKNDSTGRTLENLPTQFEVIGAPLPENGRVQIVENDTKFWADLHEGQKTGWFFDQRPHRLWVAQQAKGRSIVDVFCHTGGFGFPAMVHGAAQATFVDASGPALALARDNAVLNGVDAKCNFIEGKAFDVLEQMQPHSFDIVCVDPPAFVKTKKDLAAGLKGYEKLARQAAPIVKPGGLLFYASCSSHPTENDMLQAIFAGVQKARRQAALVYVGTAGPDHPMHPQLPETRYLKAFGFRVL